jgi:DNA-binding LacI/PurR family transcriptional regulator
MKDVAALADVSVQTVSNYVNGRYQYMGEGTRDRVAAAMSELGYHPNLPARALRSAETRTLGFLILDQHTRFLADPLTDLIFAGVGDVARERDYGILVQSSRPSDDPGKLLAPVLQSRVDGVFLLLSGDPALRRDLIRRVGEVVEKFVVFDERVVDPGVISVRAADRSGARDLALHLLERGHSRIAFVAARVPWAVVEQRYLGFVDALGEHGLEPDPTLVRMEAEWEPASAVGIAEDLLAAEQRPTAIMCGSDLLAMATVHTALRAGLRVPEDLAVSGFDDLPFTAFVHPALTTVRIPAYEMGQTAARILTDHLSDGGGGAGGEELELPVELVVREST